MNIDSIITKLSKKGTTRIESVSLLKTLKKELREKSTKGVISISGIKQIFQRILEDTDLVECPTFIVRLYLASCFSDALYIFVPNIPLTTTGELDAVFQLFSTVIPFNCQEGSTEYSIIQSIIDVLNITDSYLLISNRDVSYEMIESLIKIRPASIFNDCYDSNFNNSIKFLVNLINASTSHSIFPEVEKLFSINFNTSLIAQKALPLLSQNQQIGIIGSFQQHLSYNDFMKAFVTATKILKMSFGFIIQMLYPELINEDDSQRMAAFSLINEIFHHNKSEILIASDTLEDEIDISEDTKSINFILSRNVDKCPKIRLIIIQIASFLIENNNQRFFDRAMNVINSVRYDPNESIRFTGLEIIYKLKKQGLLNGSNDESNENDIYTFLNDKSHKIREKALICMCELVKLKKENHQNVTNSDINYLDIIIAYCFNKPCSEIFMAYSLLFDSFDSTELYEMTTEKIKYMKVLNFIKSTSEHVKKYVETGNLPNNNLVKLLTKEIWKPYVPNHKLLQIREKYKTHDAIQIILKSTNEQFAKEFTYLTIKIPINIEKLIFQCNNKSKIKDFARFVPNLFSPYLSKILVRSDKESVSILPFIFEYIFADPKKDDVNFQAFDSNENKIIEILDILVSVSTGDSLIVFAKLVSKWNCCFSTKNKIFDIVKDDEKLIFSFGSTQKEIDYKDFGSLFSLKFFFFLSIPELVPNFPFMKIKSKKKIDSKNDQPDLDKSDRNQNDHFLFNKSLCLNNQHDRHYVKWSLRLSTLFKEKDIIRIHFYFFDTFPLQCLESLLRISNVLSQDYSFSILLPFRSANDVNHYFKFAQKKGKNLLNQISVKKYRKIASFLIDSVNNNSYNMTKCYSRMNNIFWIISMLDEALKNPKTPIEFLSLVVLGLVYETKHLSQLAQLNEHVDLNELRNRIYQKAQSSLEYHVSLRRKFASQIVLSTPSVVINSSKNDQVKSAKKNSSFMNLNKSSSNDIIVEDNSNMSEITPAAPQPNSLFAEQQIELIIPSLFNVLSFFYFSHSDQQNLISIINKLFNEVVSSNQQRIMMSVVVNEVKNAVNPNSSFGAKMISICDYALSKTGKNPTNSQINFQINRKFVNDEGNNI